MKIYLTFIINLRNVFEIPNIYVELSVQWDLKRKCNSIDPAKTLKLHFQNGKNPCLPSANNNLLDNAHEHHVIPIPPNICYYIPERNKGSGLRPLQWNTSVKTAELCPGQNKLLTKSSGGNVGHLSSWTVYRINNPSDIITRSTLWVLTREFRA